MADEPSTKRRGFAWFLGAPVLSPQNNPQDSTLSDEGLHRVLAEAKLQPDEARVKRLAYNLQLIARRHRARQAPPNPKDIIERCQKICDGVGTALESLGDDELPILLNYYTFQQIEGLYSLGERAKELSERVNEERSDIRKSGARLSREKIVTHLYLDLLDLYIALTGQKGMGEGGPFYRFAKECVALIEPGLKLPNANAFRVRVITADKRRRRYPYMVRVDFRLPVETLTGQRVRI